MKKIIDMGPATTPEYKVADGKGSLELRTMTQARVSLGRHGAGLPTQAQLSFLLDHARAREAVWTNVDRALLDERLRHSGFDVLHAQSLAENRSIYVRRPDLGRLLASDSEQRLREAAKRGSFDMAIIVADGLSANAVELNAVPLIETLFPKLAILGLKPAPIVLASQARVAIGDPIGEALGVRLTLLVVGERPGLSAADSLGTYFTYGPKSGNPDSARNCISNIREGGLKIHDAAEIIAALIREMTKTRVSGVVLKAAMAKRDCELHSSSAGSHRLDVRDCQEGYLEAAGARPRRSLPRLET